MHILAAFFAFLFTFGHAHTAQSKPSDAFIPPAEYASGFEYAVPSHHDVINGTYPDAGCPGCRVTTVSYSVR